MVQTPFVRFFLRPTEIVPRHTYLNIKQNSYYTINSVQEDFADQAHHTSAKYDRDISEFDIAKISQRLSMVFLLHLLVPLHKDWNEVCRRDKNQLQ